MEQDGVVVEERSGDKGDLHCRPFAPIHEIRRRTVRFLEPRTREAEEEVSLPADLFRRRGPYPSPLFYPEKRKGMRREYYQSLGRVAVISETGRRILWPGPLIHHGALIVFYSHPLPLPNREGDRRRTAKSCFVDASQEFDRLLFPSPTPSQSGRGSEKDRVNDKDQSARPSVDSPLMERTPPWGRGR